MSRIRISRRYHVEWTLDEFGDGLSGEGLSDTWWTVKDHDEAAAFAFHDIVEIAALLNMVGDQCLDEIFLRCWKYELIEAVGVPARWRQLVQEELEPSFLSE
ncbi:hypothetical protein AC579_2933 [Pseudocercospora musae]|uniref:Uncharacterized protein n=1 Tax=Pseudocercospora musae TaxID=113226 RepID=A0A139IU35_9PEZI|nr:hypothetical protein AC579_2933 [Pseudocercospora musae]